MSPAGIATSAKAVSLSAPARFLRKYFYFLMSLLIAAIVVYGFSHTVNQTLIHPNPLPPWILYLHAPVFCGWVLFFILQTALIRTRNVPVHRTLGWFGLALAISMVVLGYMTAVRMDRFHFLQTHDPGDAAFLAIQLMDVINFATFFTLAILWRKRPEFHRRLMLIATCTLLDAAFGRFPFLPLMFIPAGVDLLILLGVARDLIVDRRIHKVYLYALPLLMVYQVFTMATFFSHAQWWVKISQALIL
jgi:hypothetical protein